MLDQILILPQQTWENISTYQAPVLYIKGVLREGFGQQIFEKAYQRRFINFNMMRHFLELSQILGVIT
jgi:hypothetical protein